MNRKRTRRLSSGRLLVALALSLSRCPAAIKVKPTRVVPSNASSNYGAPDPQEPTVTAAGTGAPSSSTSGGVAARVGGGQRGPSVPPLGSGAQVPAKYGSCASAVPFTGGSACRDLARASLPLRGMPVSAETRCLLDRGSAIDHRDHVCAANAKSADCQGTQAALVGELALATCESGSPVATK